MSGRHQMTVVHRAGTELIFLCHEDGCGRRLMIDPARQRRVVIDQGDLSVSHYGSTGQITMDVATRPFWNPTNN